jgi:hypothetical protein
MKIQLKSFGNPDKIMWESKITELGHSNKIVWKSQ